MQVPDLIRTSLLLPIGGQRETGSHKGSHEQTHAQVLALSLLTGHAMRCIRLQYLRRITLSRRGDATCRLRAGSGQ